MPSGERIVRRFIKIKRITQAIYCYYIILYSFARCPPLTRTSSRIHFLYEDIEAILVRRRYFLYPCDDWERWCYRESAPLIIVQHRLCFQMTAGV